MSSKSALQLYKSVILCAHHFDDSQFMNTSSRNRLKHNAIPTVFEDDYEMPRCQQFEPLEPAFVFTELFPSDSIPIWDEEILQGADPMASHDIELFEHNSREEISLIEEGDILQSTFTVVR